MAPRKIPGLSSRFGLGSWLCLSWLRWQRLARQAGVGRLGPAAVLATLVACSSSSGPNPPQQSAACSPVNGVACTSGVSGGSPSHLGDGGGGASDSGSGISAEGGSCPAASEIFSAATMSTSPASCVSCVEANCCQSATSCPNDPACLAVATCVVTQCLANDSSCLPT